MKKILFIMPNMLIGGVEKSLLTLLKCLFKTDGEEVNITLLFVKAEGGFLDRIPKKVNVGEIPLPEEVRQNVANIGTAKAIISAMKRGRIFRAISLYVKKKFLNIPSPELIFSIKDIDAYPEHFDVAICYTTQNSFLIEYVADKVDAEYKIAWMHSSFFKSGYKIQNSAIPLSKYDKIVGVSYKTVEEFCSLIPSLASQTQVIHNYIDVEEIISASKESPYVDESFSGIKIFTVGRLGLEKGQDIAIQALRLLVSRGLNIKWYFVGDGSLRPKLEQYISKHKLQQRAVLLGNYTNPYGAVASADIYVQPSRFEGYCITLAEAKVLKKPIVATDFVGAGEQLGEGYGIVVDTDAKSLAKAIEALYNDKCLREEYSNRLENCQITTNADIEEFCRFLRGDKNGR